MRAFAVIAAALALAGCATNVGTQTINDFSKFQQVTQGQTTKAQLHGVFGQPHRVTYTPDNTGSTWRYYQVQSRMNASTFVPIVGMLTGGNDLNITVADFTFDSGGVLRGSDRQQRTKYVNQWVGMADAITRDGSVGAVQAEMEKLGLPFDRQSAQVAAGWADWDD